MFLSFLPLLDCLGATSQAAPLPPDAPRISVADASIREGNSGFGDLSFVASIPYPVAYDVTAKAESLDMTAKAGSDYTASTGNRVVILAGQTTGLLKIRVSTDKIEERDEQFRIRMFDATNATLLDGDALGTILDDDYAGQISVSDVSVAEGNSGQKVAKALVSLSSAPLHDISISYESKDDSAKASFDDYITTRGTLLFKPNRLVLTAPVLIVGDTTPENNEKCLVRISASGYTIAKSLGVISVLNDDGAFQAGTGKIIFASFDPIQANSSRLVVINADGSNETQISPELLPDDRNNFHDNSPCFSPDGSKIAFTSTRVGGDENVFVMNADGSDVKQLSSGINNQSPAWSPDGSKVIFSSPRTPGGTDFQLRVSNPDGSAQFVLNTPLGSRAPSFSPDGTKILFTGGPVFGDQPIYSMNLDGTALKQLALGDQPSFSPDGRKITYSRNSTSASSVTDLWVMNADGSAQTRLSTGVAVPNAFPGSGDNTPTYAPDGQKIAFVSLRNSASQLFVMENDGTRQTLVKTSRPARDPFWAPGFVPPRVIPPLPPAGSGKIAFVATRSAKSEIYLINADGTQETRLTNNDAFDDAPNLSADGSKIVFLSSRDSAQNFGREIYVMNSDGSGQTRLTFKGGNSDPVFSPDGQKIAFVGARTASNSTTHDIYVINADGSGETRLTRDGNLESDLAWSPDGSKLAFVTAYESDISVIDLSSGAATRLTTQGDQSLDSAPHWSPDGSRIVFSRNIFNNTEIYLMNADGSAQTRLTMTGDNERHPCFSPDGQSLCFSLDRGDTQKLMVMSANGGAQTPLTLVGSDTAPNWSLGSVAAPAASPAAGPGPAPSGGHA